MPDLKKIIRDVLKKRLKEESSTGAGPGASHFTPGSSENYATPFAFNPDKKAKNIYYYKLGYKPVNKKKVRAAAGKVIEPKDMWKKHLNEELDINDYTKALDTKEPGVKASVEDRIKDFDIIEQKLNQLVPLIAKAKTDTINMYRSDPSYNVIWGTDMAKDYLDDLIKLFTKK